MQTQIIVKESLAGKFGPQLKDAQGFLSFGKFYNGAKEFDEGTVLDCELYVTDKGTRYINKALIVTNVATEPPKRSRKAITSPPVVSVPVNNTTEDVKWDKINRGKVKSLLLEALCGNPNVVTCVEDISKLNDPKVQAELDKLVESVF